MSIYESLDTCLNDVWLGVGRRSGDVYEDGLTDIPTARAMYGFDDIVRLVRPRLSLSVLLNVFVVTSCV